jgi:4-hydroxy-tetrahydrodipicolinate reductase
MTLIKVVVHGILGKMGHQVLDMLCREEGMEPVAGVDLRAESGSLALPVGQGSIPISNSLDSVIDGAQVVVDFSQAEGAMSVLRTAASRKVNVVVGTTGITREGIAEAESLAREHGVGIVIAPNFALGAVLMVHLAREAARFFDYADLSEMHHEAKIDAPSGTALAIASAALEGRGRPFLAPKAEKELVQGTRGGDSDGVTIHSARMPGRLAHHELVFGTLGQTLTIRHDSINRESFMPGVTMAVRKVVEGPGLTVGLDKIMGLS